MQRITLCFGAAGLILTGALISGAQASIPPSSVRQVEDFKIYPQVVYAHKNNTLTVHAVTGSKGPSSPSKNYYVFEVDSTGAPQRQLGPLNDEGGAGDRDKGDGIYTRKIYIHEQNKPALFYSVFWIAETEREPLRVSPISKVEVQYRPTFIEALKLAFHKFWNRPTE